MINHSKCDHPSTSGARAKCRRASGDATPKKVDFSQVGDAPVGRRRKGQDPDDNYGQTPGRKEDECHRCGVERIEWRGTCATTGMMLFVGPRCKWYIASADDLTPVP